MGACCSQQENDKQEVDIERKSLADPVLSEKEKLVLIIKIQAIMRMHLGYKKVHKIKQSR